jgi:uncharacterized protein
MNPQEIFSKNDHRPLPMPKGNWIIYQKWHKVLFLHWSVLPGLLKQFIPGELEVHLFKGQAWVSLVVFRLTNVRPRYLPPVPYISNADEINIRTYVKFRGKPGIYFLSMELGKSISNLLAKYLTGLPYRYSDTENTTMRYRSWNKEFRDEIDIEYEIKNKILNKSELDQWLTERYALFQNNGKHTIIEYEIHHYEWPLYGASLKRNHIRYDRFGSLIHKEPEHLHYSSGVEVLTWGRQNHKMG